MGQEGLKTKLVADSGHEGSTLLQKAKFLENIKVLLVIFVSWENEFSTVFEFLQRLQVS